MDMYYGDYQGSDQFFSKEDFIRYCGYTVSDLLLQEYRTRRQENRSDKNDEVVPFSSEWMFEERVKVEEVDGEKISLLSQSVMSFPFDRQGSGLQDVIAIKPKRIYIERGNQEEEWNYEYLPATDRIFWILQPSTKDGSKIKFYNKGLVGIEIVLVRYVPSPHDDMRIPDSIQNYVMTTTVMNMKQIEVGAVIDKTNDGNSNKVMETEINKNSLK